ncbi:MAG: hypothetical protein Q7T48_01595 [Cellvibrio sp.]|uniref:hypothetical protein n=1 Tax=Cellvibrio sp. TaxID=1965322 RepID=UPI0027264515|nr:hypothetical protein [Cellvibrio sp.]
MNYLMWLISVPALLFFTLMFVTNWRIFYHNYIKKDSFTSVIPLVGGIAGAIGLWLLPVVDIDFRWLIIPLLIEWGCIPLFLVTGFSLLNRKAGRSRGQTP